MKKPQRSRSELHHCNEKGAIEALEATLLHEKAATKSLGDATLHEKAATLQIINEQPTKFTQPVSIP